MVNDVTIKLLDSKISSIFRNQNKGWNIYDGRVEYFGLDSQMPEEMNNQFLTPCLCSDTYLDLIIFIIYNSPSMDFHRRGFDCIKTYQSTNLVVSWLS